MNTIITSKIRPLTVLFALIMLIAFGIASYILFIKQNTVKNNDTLATPILLFLLLLGGIFAIIRLTLIIKINKKKKTITFIYPFRLKSNTFGFNEVIGFRYKYLSGRVPYKSLQIRTKSGKTFALSDFETKNLGVLENEFIQLFDLRQGKHFTTISQKHKDLEVQNSKAFNRNQAKEIRFYQYLTIVFSVFLIGGSFKRYFYDNIEPTITSIIFICIVIIILIITAVKLKNTKY